MESELRIKELEEENILLTEQLKQFTNRTFDTVKEFYHSIFNEIYIPVYVVDVDETGRFTYKLSNSFNVALTGVPFEFVEDRGPEVLQSIIGAEGVDAILKLFNSCVESRDTISFELPFSFKNINRWYYNRITPLINDEGRVYRLVGTGLDITERKEAEIKYAEINEQLEAEKLKAEMNDKRKSAFLANVSHEVRTPLNGILGFTQLLKNQALPHEVSLRYIDLIEQGGIRMLEILNDLVDIAKIESGEMTFNHTSINIKDIIKEIHDFFKPEANNKNIELKFNNNQNDDILISTDKQKLHQIISNLVKNALKFTEYGTVEIGYKVNSDNISIYVKDSGIGIGEDDQKEIFERFRQSTNNNNTKDGIGLGLSICKAFTNLMGGNITVNSKLGVGSIFSVTLPNNDSHAIEATGIREDTVDTVRNDEIRVLIAEDDEICYYLLKEIFSHNNISSVRACNGKEAIDILENDSTFDCILMDRKMPVMNGIEATQIIKKRWNHIPIIVQSAYTSESDIAIALEAGANDFIPKPISKKLLMEKIKKVLP